jgi:hypothetical protein
VEEAIRDDRTHGYLQARTQLDSDTVWLHWGSNAAGWLRGVKHSKCGFKLVGKGKVVAQSPSNLRCVLLFEGKDSYDNYLEYLGPLFPVIARLAKEGVKMDNTRYSVKQTLGADYVLMAEAMGHFGASGLHGCCFCKEHRKDWGKVVTSPDGRRVPLAANMRTTKSVAAAAHRPYTTGPEVSCPYCNEPFPYEAVVKASKAPKNEEQRKRFQQAHLGMLLRLCLVKSNRTLDSYS